MPSTDSLQSLEGKGALPQVYGQPVTFTTTVTSIFDPPPDGETVSCEMRGIQPGPINTFPGWKALGRHVLKGQKAISLVMPITGKKRDEENQQAPDAADSHDSRKSECFTRFVFRRTGLYCLKPKATTLPPRPRRTGMQSGRFPFLELLAWSLRR